MEHHFSEARLVFHEAVDVFRHIEDNHYYDQQAYRKEECSKIFLKYIPI